MAYYLVCCWVVAFAGLHRVDHCLSAHEEEGWDRVGELNDANGANNADESVEVGNDGADDEGDCPVDGDHGDPDVFAGLDGQGGHFENFHTDVGVDDCRTGLVGSCDGRAEEGGLPLRPMLP